MASRNRPPPPPYSNILTSGRPLPIHTQQTVLHIPTQRDATPTFSPNPAPSNNSNPKPQTHAYTFYNSAVQGYAGKCLSPTSSVGTNGPDSPEPLEVIPAPPDPPRTRRKHGRGANTIVSEFDKRAPPCFSRRPRLCQPTRRFPPMFLFSETDRLKDGFKLDFPTTLDDSFSHPFAYRDVEDPDWLQFLEDMEQVAGLSMNTPSNPEESNIEERVKAVEAMLNLWNKKFFCKRDMKVYLARGSVVVAGSQHKPQREAPDWELIRVNLRKIKRMQGGRDVEMLFRLVVVSL